MDTKIFTNISLLAGTGNARNLLRGKNLAELPVVRNASLIIENNEGADFGEMKDYKSEENDVLPGTIILAAWCDGHTHLVFAGSTEGEFIKKISGLSYTEIAAKGGGILNSAENLNEASDDELFNQACNHKIDVSKAGTEAIKIKSGYGLTVEGELKMLRVIKKLKEKSNLIIKATFLAAHTYPKKYKNDHEGYLNLIIHEMLPVIGREKLADYIDDICEKGFFFPEEMKTICKAGSAYGLKSKIYVNQLNSIGGIEAGIKLNALSMDHLETLTEQDINLLGEYAGAATRLLSAAFFLRMNMQSARRLINANAAVTLASDYNPGFSPSGNMNFVVALSCIQMKMLPEEAINAAVINGSCAMEIQKDCGSISAGKRANLIFTKPVPSLAYLPYSFGNNLVDRVMINESYI